MKLKVGVKRVEEEIECAHAVRKALGPEVMLCADANMGMTMANARKFVTGAADAGLLFLEQPFRDNDLTGTLALARMSPIPLCADESAHSLEAIMEWQRAGAIAGVNLKTIKLGGIVTLMRAAAVSDTLGLAIDVACKTGESGIGAAALSVMRAQSRLGNQHQQPLSRDRSGQAAGAPGQGQRGMPHRPGAGGRGRRSRAAQVSRQIQIRRPPTRPPRRHPPE